MSEMPKRSIDACYHLPEKCECGKALRLEIERLNKLNSVSYYQKNLDELAIAHKHIQDMQVTNGSLTATVDQLREEVKSGDEALEELRAQNLRIAKEAMDFKGERDRLKAELERLNTGKRKPLRCLRHPDDLCQFCEICETCFQKLTDGSDHWKSVAGKLAEDIQEAVNGAPTCTTFRGERICHKSCWVCNLKETLAQYNASRGEEEEKGK